jgi:hypothetical protein
MFKLKCHILAIPAYIMFIASLSGIASRLLASIPLSLIIFSATIFIHRLIYRPVLEIRDEKVFYYPKLSVRKKSVYLGQPNEIELVVNRSDIYLRRDGCQDIFINNDYLKHSNWQKFISSLQKHGFKYGNKVT